MIVREFYKQRYDGVNLYRTYSDANFRILQHPTEIVYDEAIDVENAPYTYTETDEKRDEVSAEDALAELLEVINDTN